MRDLENGMSRAALTCEEDPSAGKEKKVPAGGPMRSTATSTIMGSTHRSRDKRARVGFPRREG